MVLCVDGAVVWLEKLLNALGGMRGAVLLLLREWEENLGTFGGSAMSLMASVPLASSKGSSGTADGCDTNERLELDGVGLAFPFAMRIESRIGLRLSILPGGGRYSSCGTGGREARSLAPIEEWLKNDSAVNQTKWRSNVMAVNFRARCGVRIKIDRLKWLPGPEPLGSGLSSLTSRTD